MYEMNYNVISQSKLWRGKRIALVFVDFFKKMNSLQGLYLICSYITNVVFAHSGEYVGGIEHERAEISNIYHRISFHMNKFHKVLFSN